MVENEVIDFLMAELLQADTCPRKIRRAVKEVVRLGSGVSLGRRMLTEQLIDALFDLYEHGRSSVVELGMALKAKLKRYVHSRVMFVRHPGIIVPLCRRSLELAM